MLENGIEAFGLRDDAALLHLPAGGPLVASVDSVVEGVHFDLALCSSADVGWKALMGALSDLAAMGATPTGALVALCVPGGTGEGDLALGVMAGVAEASAAAGCPVVGGDVSGSDVLMVAVTVLGTIRGRWTAAGRAFRGAGRGRLACHGALRGIGGGVEGVAGRIRGHRCRGRLPAPRGAAAGGRAGPGRRRPRHDRRLGRPGARRAPAGRRLGGRVPARPRPGGARSE